MTEIDCDCPTVIEVDAAESVTVATGRGAGAPMTSVAEPVWPSLVATIVADPAPIVVTSPDDDTVASSGAALDHATLRPDSTLPAASRSVAVA